MAALVKVTYYTWEKPSLSEAATVAVGARSLAGETKALRAEFCAPPARKPAKQWKDLSLIRRISGWVLLAVLVVALVASPVIFLPILPIAGLLMTIILVSLLIIRVRFALWLRSCERKYLTSLRVPQPLPREPEEIRF